MLCSYAFPQVKTGTVIVVSYTKNKIIIAADSLVTIQKPDGRIEKNRHACKISALDKKVVFASAGGLGEIDKWSASEEARLAYKRALLKHNPDFSAQITYEWATAVAPLITTTYLNHKAAMDSMIPTGILGTGIFAGVDDKGELWLTRVEFYVKRSMGDTVEYRPFKINLGECAPVCAVGRTDILREFSGLTSNRAKIEAAKWKPPRGVPADVARVIHFVDLTVTYDPTGDVGGPVDAAVIKRNGSVQWFRKKRDCE